MLCGTKAVGGIIASGTRSSRHSINWSSASFRGRILVGGDFRSFGGLVRSGLAQLHGLTEPPVLEPVVIVASPGPVSVPAGITGAFQVVATGSEPLLYQWFHNGNPLPGATNAVLTLPAVQSVDAGPYQVRVHNATNEVASPEVLLTVMPAHTISQQPLDWACFVGEHVTFQVSSTTPSARQWVHDGVPIPGATNEVLFVIGTEFTDAGSYWAELTYGEEVGSLLTAASIPGSGRPPADRRSMASYRVSWRSSSSSTTSGSSSWVVSRGCPTP